MTEYQNLPNDPAMLLSFVNTQLRDNYASFSELVAAFYADADAITEKSVSYTHLTLPTT